MMLYLLVGDPWYGMELQDISMKTYFKFWYLNNAGLSLVSNTFKSAYPSPQSPHTLVPAPQNMDDFSKEPFHVNLPQFYNTDLRLRHMYWQNIFSFHIVHIISHWYLITRCHWQGHAISVFCG